MTGEAGPRGSAEGSEGDQGTTGRQRHATCELCGGPVLERHCKITCLRCGYQRDCSDP